MAWSLDPMHAQVGFSARHLGLSTVRGQFTDIAVTDVTFDPERPESARGTVEIGSASLVTNDARRDGHLKGADFLDVERYPTITFRVADVLRKGDAYEVTGDLAIRGVTRRVRLDGEFYGVSPDPYGNRKAGIGLTGTINRKEWGLQWNVAIEGGGLLVSEKVKLEIEVQLVEEKVAAAVG